MDDDAGAEETDSRHDALHDTIRAGREDLVAERSEAGRGERGQRNRARFDLRSRDLPFPPDEEAEQAASAARPTMIKSMREGTSRSAHVQRVDFAHSSSISPGRHVLSNHGSSGL
jgi:hypothetical protein